MALAIVAAGLAAGVAWFRARSDAPARHPIDALHATVAVPPGTVLAIGRAPSIAVSPDGRDLVFAGDAGGTPRLYRRPLGRMAATPIDGTDGASDPVFSPEGNWVGFFVGPHLKKVPIDGGAAAIVAEAPTRRGLTWGPGDVIYLTPRDNAGVWRVPATGGTMEQVTSLAEGDASHRWPDVLPDGRHLTYTIWNGAWETAQIAIVPIDGSAPRRVVVTGGGFGRIVGGRLVYARGDELLAVPFDLERLQTAGEAVRIAEGVISNFSGAAQLAVSAAGVLAYVPAADPPAERALTWVDRQGRPSPATTLRGPGRWYDLSPDGSRVVRYNMQDARRGVWIDDIGARTSERATGDADLSSSGPADRLNAIWSADGRHVAYARGSPLNLYLAAVGADAGAARLTTSEHTQWPGSWSPDGRTVAYVEQDALSGSDIWLLALDEQRKPAGTRAFLRTPFNESAPMISPDGRWIAYQSNESGQYEIYVQPFPDGGQRHQLSFDNGVYPRWSPRADEVFFRSGANRAGLSSVALTPAAPSPAKPRLLFEIGGYESIFDVGPDASRFLMMPALSRQSAPTQINILIEHRNDDREP
jgi:serine/threonine-protein kinase